MNKYFLIIFVFFVSLISFLIVPQHLNAQTYSPILPEDLSNEIDQFLGAGADGYIVWLYSGDRGGGQEFANDRFSFFRNTPPGPDICAVLREKSVGSSFVGVNMWDAGDPRHSEGKLVDHFSYLRNECGVTVIRSFASVGGIGGVQKQLNAAQATGVQMLFSVANAATGDQFMPPPPTPVDWYASGYIASGYRDFAEQIANTFGSHPALYGLELANEPHCGGDASAFPAYKAWADDVSARIRGRGVDRVGIGQMASQTLAYCDNPDQAFSQSNSGTSITMASGHYYNEVEKNQVLKALNQTLALGKSFYIGEAGWGGSAIEPSEPYDVEQYTPCNQTRNPEFHSLRPYPASPCDEEPVVTPALCADDLVARVEYTFQNCNPGNGGGLCTYNVTTDNIEITLGVQTAELPIVGNTEDVPNSVTSASNLDSTTRMNEYVSWYLNGITSRAEEEDEITVQQGRVPPLSQSQIENRINEVINLSGPIKKLLPYAHQFNEVNMCGIIPCFPPFGDRFSVEGYREEQKGLAGTERHNQIVLCTNQGDFWPRACYRTDNEVRRRMVGESTLDARLLDQHNRLFSFIPFSSTEDRVGTLSADRRGYVVEGGEGTEDGGAGVDPQSIVFTPNQDLEGPINGLNLPFRRLYFAHMQETDELGDILQGTFVPRGEERAPTMVQPGIDQQRLSPFCEPVEEPISNPGDNLYAALERNGGEPVQGDLSFSASFNCEFPDPIPNQQCINDCVFNNPSSPDPTYPDSVSYCTAQCGTTAVTECTRTVLIPMQVQITTPLADNLWSRFVFGTTSIFRRMFPRIEEGAPVDEILDIPGESNISYSATGGDTQGTASDISVRPIAGNPYEGSGSNTGNLYFPHLGSLHEYFLNGIQCALRPRGLCGNEEFASDLPPGGSSQPGLCSIEGSAIMSQELRNIIANAARWANIPVELLITVVRGEGCGGGGRTGGICQYTDAQVLQFSAPGAVDPRNCPASGSKGPLQMYEDSVNWTPWMNAVNMATGENRTPEICNLKDAIYAGAYRLSAGFDSCPNAGHSVSSVPLSSWNINQVRNTLTAWGQGCSVPQCSGVAGGFYCTQYDLWSSQITTDCN